MSSMETAPLSVSGEIVRAGRIIEEADAIDLGRSILDVANSYDYTLNTVRSRRQKTARVHESVNSVRLGAKERETVAQAQAAFRDFVKTTSIRRAEPVHTDFFFNAAVDGMWHTDVRGDLRLLVNTSSFPISLKVAKEWEWNRDLMFGAEDFTPADYETLVYGPGEGVTLNNLRTPPDQTPHAGSTEPGKVFMRIMTADRAPYY